MAAVSEGLAAVIPAEGEQAVVGNDQQILEKALAELVDKLKAALGERLVSVILYGSAAAGDWQKKSSDLNVLCVLDRITPGELAKSQPMFHWWRERGNPRPYC